MKTNLVYELNQLQSMIIKLWSMFFFDWKRLNTWNETVWTSLSFSFRFKFLSSFASVSLTFVTSYFDFEANCKTTFRSSSVVLARILVASGNMMLSIHHMDYPWCMYTRVQNVHTTVWMEGLQVPKPWRTMVVFQLWWLVEWFLQAISNCESHVISNPEVTNVYCTSWALASCIFQQNELLFGTPAKSSHEY